MFHAGVGWSERGYCLTVLDDSGNDHRALEVAPDAFGVESLVRTLKHSVDPADGRLDCFVDSSAGVLAGLLVEAGLDVYRLDPPLVAARPDDTRSLAQIGRLAAGRAKRLDREGGFLRGRIHEYLTHCDSCADLDAELARSGGLLAHGNRTRQDLALTFDDGPQPPYTDQVLDILDDLGVPATFFCLGLSAMAYSSRVLRARSAGHCVANHTWSHPYLPDLPDSELNFQVLATESTLSAVTGQSPRLFRPPYGARTPQIERKLVALGQTVVTWDVDSCDWLSPGPQSIAERVLDNVDNGSVVLFHDGGGDRSQTVAALPLIIENLLHRGYRLVTVERLLSTVAWSAPEPARRPGGGAPQDEVQAPP